MKKVKASKGFNLIESALVLGVVGLVLGGSWVAISTVRENLQVKTIREGIISTVGNIQNLISISQSEAIGSSNITNSLIASQVFPKDWIKNSTTAQTPYGHNLGIYNFASNPRFDLIVKRVSSSVCAQLITSISVMAAQSGEGIGASANARSTLGYVQVRIIDTTTNVYATLSFPISPTDAASACVNDVSDIVFTYGYSRVN